MSDRRDTILNIEREPATRVYTESGGGFGVLAGVIIPVLLIVFFAFFFFRPAERVVPTAPNVTIENPAPVSPAPEPITRATPVTRAPAPTNQ